MRTFLKYSLVSLVLLSAGTPLAESASMTLALGDSITEGGSVLSGSPNWPELLQTARAGSPHRFSVTNAGKSGDTSTGALDRWTTQYRHHGYKRVIICIGTNDLAEGVSAPTIFTNIQTIAYQAQADGIEVVVCTVLPRKNGPSYSSDLQARLDALNTSIRALPVNGFLVADLYANMGGTDPQELRASYDWGDHLHPNASGHLKIRDLILAAVTW